MIPLWPVLPATRPHLLLIIFSQIAVSRSLEKHMETMSSNTFQQPIFFLHYGTCSLIDTSLAKGLSGKLLRVIPSPTSLVIAAAVWLAGGHLELMCVDQGRQQRQKVDSHRADSQHTPSAFYLQSSETIIQPILIALLNWLNDYLFVIGMKKSRESWVLPAHIH